MPTVGGLALADNPFINRSTSPVSGSPSSYGTVMPWQTAPATSSSAQDVTLASTTPEVRQSQTLRQIDEMMDNLQEKTGHPGYRDRCRCADATANRGSAS